MNITINDIKSPIKSQLKEFETYFKNSLQTDNKLLNIVLRYIVSNKGKQLRPIIVLLAAQLEGDINEKTYVAASMVELLHTATLIHDDVVDNSQLRRSNFSIKALWKSKLSVLVGDYMLAQGLKMSVDNKAYDILSVVSETVQSMALGELIQIEKSRKLNITEKVYFEIIEKKTGSLLIASAKSGLLSVTNDQKKISCIEKFAHKLGIAFQIKDDLFDYDKTNIIGKPQANDIQESKLTLPLIFALNNSNKADRRKILKILGLKNKNLMQIRIVQKFVITHGGINYSEKIMKQFSDEAVTLLRTCFKDSSARNSLEALVQYIITRTK